MCRREMEGVKRSREEEKEEAEAKVEIWKYIFGFVGTAVVKCAIELGIADILETQQSPMTLHQLSSTVGCSPSLLHRMMRFLVHRKIFKETPTGGYIQTPLSRLLVKDGENSMAAFILLETSAVTVASLNQLNAGVLDERVTPFQAAHGTDVWSYAAENGGYGKLLSDAMGCVARMMTPAVLERSPEMFEGLGTVVDVGGGNGTTLQIVVKKYPWIRGINFDLPHVVARAPTCHGVQHVGGDMFAAVPKADAALITNVLHDWRDEECVSILKNCKKIIPKDKGKVIIIERVIGDEEGNNEMEDVKLIIDMAMMAHTKRGKERTVKEWEYLLTQAGFGRHNIKGTQTPVSIIEAYPQA